MARTTMLMLMLAVAVAAALHAAHTAHRIAATKQHPGEWRLGLTSVALVTQLVLLTNALAFLDWPWLTAAEAPGRLLEEQLWLLAGTASLMFLTSAALKTRPVRTAPDPDTAAGRVLSAVVERLLLRFWWAALGFGLVFGIRAPGVALLLAVELSLVWLVGKVWGGRHAGDRTD